MNQLVTEARALCEGATEGPWTLIKEGRYEDHDECRIDLPDDNIELCRYENGELVARSRTLLPEMAAEIKRLEAELDALKADVEAVGEWPVTVGSSLIVNGKRIKITGADYMTQQVTIEWPGCDSRTDQSWPR